MYHGNEGGGSRVAGMDSPVPIARGRAIWGVGEMGVERERRGLRDGRAAREVRAGGRGLVRRQRRGSIFVLDRGEGVKDLTCR
jgi:hypothetical protein